MVRSYIAGKPHEAYVITTELFYATAGIDITQMHRQESEASCVGGTQNSLLGGILTVKCFKVYLFNDAVNNPDRIVPGNKIA